MEFLKTCSTNAQAIADYEAVAFQAFSIKRTPSRPSPNFRDRAHSDDLHAIEAEFRQGQHLVVQDASKSLLWFFRGTTPDKAGQKPMALPVSEGYDFIPSQSGVIKASELAKNPSRSANHAAASVSSSFKTSQGSTARMQQVNAQSSQGPDQPQHDTYAIYELFISSVVALLAYYMIRDHGAIALNFRTFVTKPLVHGAVEEDEPRAATLGLWLTNINVYWTSSGTLVVAMLSVPRPDIRSLDAITEEDSLTRLVGKCVRVAPNGSLAKVVGFEDTTDPAAEDAIQQNRRKRARTNPWEQKIENWKALVLRWLQSKGYAIPNSERKAAWVRICVAHASQLASPSPTATSQALEVLWPRSLCLTHDVPLDLSLDARNYQSTTLGKRDDGLEWFQTPDSTGFQDPIDVAQQWYLHKPERDKALEARHRAQKAEEEAAQPKEEIAGLIPSSPIYARTGAYGDLQAVSGVYPTPPDGVAPGVAIPGSDTTGGAGAGGNTILAHGGTNPAINISAPPNNHPAAGEPNNPTTSPEVPLPSDQHGVSASGGNDDLFEDMDEDTYDGNGVTDADFNFFDEQDEGMDMMDTALPQGPKQEVISGDDSRDDQLMADTALKDELPDPMAALEEALASGPEPPNPHAKEIKLEPTEQDKMLSLRRDPQKVEPIPETPSPSAATQPSALAAKELTPPLSPHLIHRRLLPSPKNSRLEYPMSGLDQQPNSSIFNPLNFSRKMSLADAKYHGGRFSVSEAPKDGKVDKPLPPSGGNLSLLTLLPQGVSVVVDRGVSALGRAGDDLSDVSSVSSLIDDESAADEVTSNGPVPLSAGLVSGKRKLPTDGNATPTSTASLAESWRGENVDPGLQTDGSCLLWFESTPWDWPLSYVPGPAALPLERIRKDVPAFSSTFGSSPGTPTSQPDVSLDPPDEKPLSGKDSIAVSQIVTDQIVHATLDILHVETALQRPFDAASSGMSGRSGSPSALAGLVKTLFPKATDCNVLGLASVQDVFPDQQQQGKSQQRQVPRRMNAQADGTALPGHLIYQINPPHVRVRRADTLWDMLPPALAFWEPLGLAPCSPVKNIVAFCIHPSSDSLRPCLETFLVSIQLAYESSKFGSHARVETVSEYEGGLVPWECTTPTSPISTPFKALKDTCVQLGKLLALKHAQMKSKADSQRLDAFVIYMVDPFEKPSALWELCSAFWTLFQAYGQGPAARHDASPKPDLVLQIIPMKYVASFNTPVVLETSAYNRLAREVYDRCPPSAPSEDKTPLGIYCAPSFQLEEALPRLISFKVVAEPPQDLLKENSYMHLGYAISLDGSWITAAWTDNSGKSQAVVSYNVGSRSFGEVAREIWQTTIEILQARRVTWRVCVAKAGVMEKEEFDAWTFLAACPTQLNLFITLLTVDLTPPLKLTPTIPLNAVASSSVAQPSTNTPGSTPQAGVSPDQPGLTPAATPNENAADASNDPDARLVDITDESWGIILSHRLHNTNSTVEFRPCLISGLLVKRGETYATSSPITNQIPDPERGPIVVGVNILWVGAVGSTRAATSPFPPSASVAAEGVSPGGMGGGPGMGQAERSTTSLQWTGTAQARATAENLLKEVLGQFRALGLLAKLKGTRGTKHGAVPWHVAAAVRGVRGISRCAPV